MGQDETHNNQNKFKICIQITVQQSTMAKKYKSQEKNNDF